MGVRRDDAVETAEAARTEKRKSIHALKKLLPPTLEEPFTVPIFHPLPCPVPAIITSQCTQLVYVAREREMQSIKAALWQWISPFVCVRVDW